MTTVPLLEAERLNVELAPRLSGRDPAQARAAATGWLEELFRSTRPRRYDRTLPSGLDDPVAVSPP
jgi:hypothetical protein